MVSPYRGAKLLHISASAGIIRKYGANYDLTRPGSHLCLPACMLSPVSIHMVAGISLYGLPPDTELPEFQSYGFQPALAWVAYPTLVKACDN